MSGEASWHLPRGWRIPEITPKHLAGRAFADVWQEVCRDSRILQRGEPLRPSDLPRQIAAANAILRQLRLPVSAPKIVPADRRHRAAAFEPAV